MSDFRVVVQSTPLINNMPRTLLVSRVETPEQAYVLVFDHLVRKGEVIASSDFDITSLGLSVDELRRAGIGLPRETYTTVRSVTPFSRYRQPRAMPKEVSCSP